MDPQDSETELCELRSELPQVNPQEPLETGVRPEVLRLQGWLQMLLQGASWSQGVFGGGLSIESRGRARLCLTSGIPPDTVLSEGQRHPSCRVERDTGSAVDRAGDTRRWLS